MEGISAEGKISRGPNLEQTFQFVGSESTPRLPKRHGEKGARNMPFCQEVQAGEGVIT